MSLTRFQGIDPGRIGVFAGPLNGQPTAIQRLGRPQSYRR
jgi:hypothetical protein